jgi:hypothetical protein
VPSQLGLLTPQLVERHLAQLQAHRRQAVSGVEQDRGAAVYTHQRGDTQHTFKQRSGRYITNGALDGPTQMHVPGQKHVSTAAPSRDGVSCGPARGPVVAGRGGGATNAAPCDAPWTVGDIGGATALDGTAADGGAAGLRGLSRALSSLGTPSAGAGEVSYTAATPSTAAADADVCTAAAAAAAAAAVASPPSTHTCASRV